MVPKFPAEWFFTLEYWQRQKPLELTGGVWFEWQLHLPSAEQWRVDVQGSGWDNSKQSMARASFLGLIWRSLGVQMMKDVKMLKDWDEQETKVERWQWRRQSLREGQLSQSGCVLLMLSAGSTQSWLSLSPGPLPESQCHSWGALPGTAVPGCAVCAGLPCQPQLCHHQHWEQSSGLACTDPAVSHRESQPAACSAWVCF